MTKGRGKHCGSWRTNGLFWRVQNQVLYLLFVPSVSGTWWRSWLSRKVAGSIPHGVNEIALWRNTSGRAIAVDLSFNRK